ncbi:MAG: M48 family metallopeptidase [Rhizonema sp. NSF051]|nr:M48 family metallopeptidase [Rhizonema sp. NSF051]
MNFFENQDRARHKTQQLIGLFVLSIAAIIVAIYIATLFLFHLAPRMWWYPPLFIVVAGVTTAVIVVPSLYKFICLREGGKAIAKELGGRLLPLETVDAQERQLLNIVQEMAIASGISVPSVYLLHLEPGINAFAAGFSPNTAVIGVTRGCLEHLNRDELQGVIGHEFSHILNGDMGLNLRLVALLHGILFIYQTGLLIVYFRSDSRDDNEDNKDQSLWVFGLALMAIGVLGLICGRLIKAAVSRQREFLADASAVQFTRNSEGISGALEKLQRMGSHLNSSGAEAASHMFFGNALQLSFWEGMFATHPPLTERIRSIRGLKPGDPMPSAVSNEMHSDESLAMGFAGKTTEPLPENVVAQVGTVAPEHFADAQELLSSLPESLRLSVHNQQSAMAIVFALVLDRTNTQIRDRQIAWLRQVQPSDLVDKTLSLSSEINLLDLGIRLPLLDLTVPALRQGSPKDCQRLCKCVQGLIIAGTVSMWEFVFQLVLWHRLQPCFAPSSPQTVQFTSIEQIWSDCILLLSALAQVGQSQPETVAYAFRSGVFRLPGIGQLEAPQAPIACNFADVKKSIDRLCLASPKLKQAIVDACAHTVLVDRQVSPNQANLLRGIAMTLDCPIPPFLTKAASG